MTKLHLNTGLTMSLLALAAVTAVAAPLPEFSSSDPAHDRLLNDLLRRHLRIDVSDTSLRQAEQAVVPGICTCTLWRDWEVDSSLWYDASQANFPHEDRIAGMIGLFTTIPVDRFGYVFSAHDAITPPLMGPQVMFGMGWPFPEYVLALGSQSAGWEWNGTDPEGWTVANAAQSEVRDGLWRLTSGPGRLEATSPSFAADSLHAPFVLVDLTYPEVDAATPSADCAFVLYWTTREAPDFSETRCVRSDTWPVIPVPALATGFGKRVWLPMHLHPEWGGKTITRLRFVPLAAAGHPVTVHLNNLRLNYDTRHAINNPVFVRGSARFFFWTGDAAWLRTELPRLRRATEFMLTHLRGRELGLLDQTYFVGHDGLGWARDVERRVGHGLGTNYFDILPMGPRDLQTCVYFLQALEAMAAVEAYVESHPEFDQAKPAVSAPDGLGTVPYRETSATLRALCARSRLAIHREFWLPAVGRYAGWRDVSGVPRDYGYTHFNFEAMAAGVPDEATARAVLDWVNGVRVVSGDTSTGDDIYHWEFAARLSTRRNALDYAWCYSTEPADGGPVDEIKQAVASRVFPFGAQVQDGGASLFTTFFDLKARLRYGDAAGAWRVWRGMLDHHAKVLAQRGKGRRFYRDYYAADPARGTLQGGGPPGGLGLDEEFVESLLTPTAWATAWIGLEAPEPDVLQIAPTLPPGLTEIGLRHAVYRGNRIDIRAAAGCIDLTGSALPHPTVETLRLLFRGVYPPGTQVLRDGTPAPGSVRVTATGLWLDNTPLSASRFEARRP